MLLASFAHGQNDGIANFTAADIFNDGAVNLVTLVPSFNIPLITKSQGPLPGSVGIQSSQACYVRWNSGGTNSSTYCGVSSSMLAQLLFMPNELMGMSSDSVTAYVGGIHSCYDVTIKHLVGADGLSSHSIPTTTLSSQAGCGSSSATVTTSDGTGITATLTAGGVGGSMNVIVSALHNASGWVYTPNSGTVNDPFGNSVSITGTNPNDMFTDTLGASTAFTNVYGGLNGPIKYTDTTGTQQTISMVNGTASTFQPLGSCGTLNTGRAVTPVSAINFPDETSIGLIWDANNGGLDGLIKSVTLRTGGTISYTYGATFGDVCDYAWAFSTLSRTTPDGTTSYSISYTQGNSYMTTTVLDPGKNKKVYVFLGTPNGGSGGSLNFIQSVTRYQNTGTVASPVYTLVSSTSYCYNTICGTSSIPNYPITQRDTYEYIGTGSTQVSHRVQTYDAYGDTLTTATTDSITGQTLTTTTTYGSWNGSSCVAVGSNIVNKPCDVSISDGTYTLSHVRYTYSSEGFKTQIQQWTGLTWLTSSATPNSNGTVATSTTLNGQITNYSYAATGSGGCNALLLTGTSTTVNGVNLTTGQTWDCNGAVILSKTDSNSNTAHYSYDELFRIGSSSDMAGFTTNAMYTATTITTTNTYLDNILTVDGLGRPILSQTADGSQYDTVSTSYSWVGPNRTIGKSYPCPTSLGGGCTINNNETIDPLGRTMVVSDTDGYSATNAYTANDVTTTVGPPPSGEHVKTSQVELDGIGRTKSACKIETSGGTACGEAAGGSGVVDNYSYSFGAGTSTVSATRGVQTHTTVKDGLGRVTSSVTPESGTMTYLYDADNTGDVCGNGRTPALGLLMKVSYQDESYLCYDYDSLGRVLAVGTSDQSGSPARRFKYDTTGGSAGYVCNLPQPTGYIGNNLAGRLVEAETDTPSGQCGGTDEWFSYDADGRITDVWELTPHSGQYYHAKVAFYGNGKVSSLQVANPSFDVFSYGVDADGRWNTLTDTTLNHNLVTATTYNAASQPTNIALTGTGPDQDDYVYDPVTGLMTKYTFQVGSTTTVGNLTWNGNRTLNQLQIIDGFNAGGSQTCSYNPQSVAGTGYDDLGRLVGVSCGSIWSQTFQYDQYDNIDIFGNNAWTPTYNASNQYNVAGMTYDANGNLTYDNSNHYSWDVYGRLATVATISSPQCGTSGTCFTYDALGHVVEINNSGTISEIVYSAMGKTAVMSGSTLTYTYLPAPGAGTVINEPGGAYSYVHRDWLGTARLGSGVQNHQIYYDRAFAPYGEMYDNFASAGWVDFTGDMQDMAAGYNLYDTPNRELPNWQGRWLSPDPAHASWNAYAYPTDPNRQTDPSGAFMLTAELDRLWQTNPTDYALLSYWQLEAFQAENSSSNQVGFTTSRIIWYREVEDPSEQANAQDTAAFFMVFGTFAAADPVVQAINGLSTCSTYLGCGEAGAIGGLALLTDGESGAVTDFATDEAASALSTAEQSMVTLYHGTDFASATDILENGFDMSKAAELGGGDALWTTTSASDAGWFAAANPSGGPPGILQITVPEATINSLSSQGLVSIEGSVYRFQPGAMDVLNNSGTITWAQ